MILSDRTMKLLMELDAPIDQKVALLNSMRTDEAEALPSRSKGAERQARYEARRRQKSSESVSDDAERHPSGETLSLPPSPQTPQPPTHTRECITTPTRKAVDFERFWGAYPRKVGKGDARKAFDRACRKIGDGADGVLSGALERAKAAWTDAQFIPHPATWLNRESWEDEPQLDTSRKANDRNHHPPPDRNDKLRAMLAGAMAASDDAKHGL